MGELWDLYDENRNLVGETHERGVKVPKNRYHIVVDIWTISKDGRILLDQRHPDKHAGLRWECTGGSVLKGEDSRTGAIRELGEELGIHVKPEHLQLLDQVRVTDRFVDSYVNLYDVKLDELILQETEVVDAKLITFEELLQLWKNGEVSPTQRFKRYQDKLYEWIEKVKKGEWY